MVKFLGFVMLAYAVVVGAVTFVAMPHDKALRLYDCYTYVDCYVAAFKEIPNELTLKKFGFRLYNTNTPQSY